jgi:hypothetical protein
MRRVKLSWDLEDRRYQPRGNLHFGFKPAALKIFLKSYHVERQSESDSDE